MLESFVDVYTLFKLISGVTKLRENVYGEAAKLCERIVGYDANALYLWSMSQEMPTGMVEVRDCEHKFAPQMEKNWSKACITW